MKRMEKLNLTEIKPEGWLLDQLKVQMNGLTGILYDMWDSVGSYSGWLGGTGESWERAPYYLDGLLPLSYYLGDKKHWEICSRFIEWTLQSQDETGNFGPLSTKNQEQWSRYAMLKVLIQYAEITGDKRVIPFAMNYLKYIAELSKTVKIREWSEARIPDLLYVGKWVYNKTKDPQVLKLMEQIDKHSIDWCDYLEDLPFPRPASYYINWKRFEEQTSKYSLEEMVPYHKTHIVNVTMGFKHPAVRSIFNFEKDYEKVAIEGIQEMIRKHGVVSGCINGDEHLAGNNPIQGSELCSVVEYMFSLQALIEAFGNTEFGDQMERLAYNALPATITEDFMGHQYLQQANQIIVDDSERPWFNNSKESTVFGLEPNFGCCTANMHQGWPKFVNSLWYRENENTLMSMVFAPNTVTTTLGGEDVAIQLQTEYPFRDQLKYIIKKSPKKEIIVKIRIPRWCKEPQIICEGAEIEIDKHTYEILVKKQFDTEDQILVRLPMEIRYTKWYHNSVAVERGPLVYGLDMKERWEVKKEVAGVKDYYIYPESDWNYALSVKENVEVEEREISAVPFSKSAAPTRLQLWGRKVESWKAQSGNTTEIPVSPVEVSGEDEKISLIPFGCTKLRISQFPFYENK
ncbi:MAG: beta-L-arabinofuranosidase domain-containing protein [Marvinbryantia sp.]|jgi:hypothetical protein